MKTRTYRQHGKCISCKRIVMPCEKVGLCGRNEMGRDKIMCMTCKNLKR